MKENKLKELFIELRAKGFSYAAIAEELHVSKLTLIQWAKQFENDINNLRAIELETLREQFALTKKAKIEALGELINRIKAEMATRDLSAVPTERLLNILVKLHDLTGADSVYFLRSKGAFYEERETVYYEG